MPPVNPFGARHGTGNLVERSTRRDDGRPVLRLARDRYRGLDPADPTAAPFPVPEYLAACGAGVAGLTCGIDWEFVRAYASDTVIASLEPVIELLRELGARIVDVTFPDPAEILHGWATQCAVEAALAHRATFPARRSDYGERLEALLDRGTAIGGTELAQTQAHRRDFNGRMAALFATVDVLVVPALPIVGPTLAAILAGEPTECAPA